jgi:hypothetical protein
MVFSRSELPQSAYSDLLGFRSRMQLIRRIESGLMKRIPQLGRSFGLVCNRLRITDASSGEYLFETLGYEPFMTFLYRPSMSSALNGGLSIVISYKTQPKDHISDLES